MFNSGEIIALVSIAAGFILLFVPVAALTTRKIVRDVTEMLAQKRGGGGEASVELLGTLREEVARLSEDVNGLRVEVRKLREASEFERRLRSSSES